jgi:hypothetical protein
MERGLEGIRGLFYVAPCTGANAERGKGPMGAYRTIFVCVVTTCDQTAPYRGPSWRPRRCDRASGTRP